MKWNRDLPATWDACPRYVPRRHVALDVVEYEGSVAIYELENGADAGVRLDEDDLVDVEE